MGFNGASCDSCNGVGSGINVGGDGAAFSRDGASVSRSGVYRFLHLFAYETVKKHLTPKPGEQPKLPIPASPIAGAIGGISSTLCTYPLELLKTRLTIQGCLQHLLDAIVKIVQEEGPAELYRGLTPSLIGTYKKAFNQEDIGNIATLLIGSGTGAISSTATLPLEVARKHMQAGAINGRQYHNMLRALTCILEKGLGPSCAKLVPAAGISFMCYEACKRILVENEDDP
ncbi:hypothetical protein RJ639_021448 [Escallonia herrerae]|uniref:Mitochondrial carrier protein n=1 Tax=Escallonia herrerae TaxID=1293975 RepID=A0AA89AFY9_9ASTE|nr:hypothetical protein RJ639_021448 [Escallonia herrerae]